MGDEDRVLTVAEEDCVLTSSDEDVEDLSAFVTERLQCLSEGVDEELIGDASVNVEEILYGGVGVEEGGAGNEQSVCPNVTPGGDVQMSNGSPRASKPIGFCETSWIVQTLQQLQKGLYGPFTPRNAAWC